MPPVPGKRHNRPMKHNEGSTPAGAEPSFLAVARIRKPHGIRGEIVLELLADSSRRLLDAQALYLGEERIPLSAFTLRPHGRDWLLHCEGWDDRNAVEQLRGKVLFVRGEELPPLPAGTFYVHQIEGLEVFTEEGEDLGRVKEILKTGANDVYVVQGEKGEILLPAIPQVIREVRLEEGRMIVQLMDGIV